MNVKSLGLIMSLVVFCFLTVATTNATAACSFTTVGTEMVLNASCNTSSTIFIPDGMTMDLNQNTITGVDPSGGHFVGAVVKNGGSKADITNGTVTVSGLANVCDGGNDRLRGVWFVGASGSITNLNVPNINQGISGCQEGNAVEIRNLGETSGSVSVTIDTNTITGYQKTGIVANGNVIVTITNNIVAGSGPVNYIAQNGIQIGYGTTGMVKRNTVTGNSYTGSSAVSGGILVVGGPGYGAGFAFCVGVQIMQNVIRENDIGVYLSQFEADYSAPSIATNIKVVNNVISKAGLTNGYSGGYQAGISDVGNNDKIINNNISGNGYTGTYPGAYTVPIDADTAYTTKPKVHANH